MPSNWDELHDEDSPGWEGFPQQLYTTSNDGDNDDEQRLQEISLNSPYVSDHPNPILKVRAKTSEIDPNIYFGLNIMKFNKKIPIALTRMNNKYGFISYESPVGLITGGDVNEKNGIIIRCYGPPNGSIIFDALYLYYDTTDSDEDGVWDSDEDDAYLDQRVANLLKIGRDPTDKKRFTLKIQEPEGTIPCFLNVRFVDINTLPGVEGLKSAYYFPYGFLGFQVVEVEPRGRVAIQIAYQDTHNPESKFSPFLRCFAYQDTNIWQEIDFCFLDDNTVRINIENEGDEGNGEGDGGENKCIDTILAFSYPQELDVTVDKKGCFLHSISRRK